MKTALFKGACLTYSDWSLCPTEISWFFYYYWETQSIFNPFHICRRSLFFKQLPSICWPWAENLKPIKHFWSRKNLLSRGLMGRRVKRNFLIFFAKEKDVPWVSYWKGLRHQSEGKNSTLFLVKVSRIGQKQMPTWNAESLRKFTNL